MAKDIYQNLVRQALENEGWTITDDPYYFPIAFIRKRLSVYFAAEKYIGAEQGTEKILVEIKSFRTDSHINEFFHFFTQYTYYASLLKEKEPDLISYMAMPKDIYEDLIIEDIVQTCLEIDNVKLIIFDTQNPIIYEWKR
jgi:hypothetical protein